MGLLDDILRPLASDVLDLFTDTPVTIRRTLATAYDPATGTPDLGTSTTEFTRATGSFVDDGFIIGDTVEARGFSNAGNNGTFSVAAVAALALTVEETLTVESQGTGKTLRRVADHVAKASPPLDYTLREIDGTAIQRGDKRFLFAAQDLAIEPSPETDRVIHGGVTYRVIAVKPIVSGDQNALFDVQVRR